MESSKETVIRVEDLRKRYGATRAVDGVSFAVERGDIFGVVGPNGAGKTTIVECLAGLRRPDGGTVRVLGRAVLWILLPLSFVGALFLVWQGVPMNFGQYTTAATLEGGTQTIAQGPVAALEIIKNLGTNGGGFFYVNGAHPYENPTPLTNVVEMLAIVALPAALTDTFGRMTGRSREGRLLLNAMVVLFVAGLLACGWAEQGGNPLLEREAGVAAVSESDSPGGNMEGKEVRFGVGGSVLAAITTSNGATGSYNSMHDSYMPLGGGVPLFNMLLGEVIFGGLGTGLYSIILVALIALFLAGLMTGRRPQYISKEVGTSEISLIALYTLAAPVAVLSLSALALVTEGGLAGLVTNSGPHGFTEILYAYTSSFANNGQSFAGLSVNTPFYNVTTALAMLAGRFALAIPALALAGLLARQRRRAIVAGTLSTDTWTFEVLLVGTILIVGGLSYFPALALGPVVEHLIMNG